ncbi:MAG: peroxiredoxin [Phycisphaerales bacterium]|nr:peroxiredoxin [Phycisphaerales bacterium]
MGAEAPAFTLPDHDGKLVALEDQSRRWVLLCFYPTDDTPGCTVEACDFTAAMPGFRGMDTVVYGCGADGAFGKKMMYGKEVEGVIRSTALIAPDGVIAQHWPKGKAEGHAEAVRDALAALQGGAACRPARPSLHCEHDRPQSAGVASPPAVPDQLHRRDRQQRRRGARADAGGARDRAREGRRRREGRRAPPAAGRQPAHAEQLRARRRGRLDGGGDPARGSAAAPAGPARRSRRLRQRRIVVSVRGAA